MWKWLLAAILLLAAVGVAAAMLLGPALRPKPPEFKTAAIGRGDIVILVTASGTINPLRTVFIGSQVSGKVKDVLKVANDTVKAGETLARIDTELLEAELRAAEIRLAQAQAAHKQVLVERENLTIRRLRHSQAVTQKKIRIERQRGTLELAQKNLTRYKDLLVVDATTQTEVDIRVLEEANARRDQALAEIELELSAADAQQIEADAKSLEAREEQARADIAQAESSVARARTNLGYATIVSPIDGVVLEHLVEPGQTVAASFQTPNMFRVATDLANVRIDAKLDEADIGRIRVGQEVTFDVDAYRNETFEGVVAIVRLAPEAKNNLVTYPVLVQATNPKSGAGAVELKKIPPEVLRTLGVTPVNHGWKLLPGMTANIRFTVDKKTAVLRLPGAALRFIPPMGFAPPQKKESVPSADRKRGTRGTVYVLDAEKKLQPRTVLVGETDGDYFELLESELKEGDEVVTGVKL